IGHGLDPATELGPVVDQDQFDKVSYYLRAGIEDGGRALTGGGRHGDTGYFIEPTVFVDVKPEDRVVTDEISGPVVSALRFSDLADAVRQGNDSMYGLAAGVWTQDISKAHKVASRLQAGSVWVNQYNGFDTAMPFGGFKQSGWGRGAGEGAVDLYTQTRTVKMQLARRGRGGG